MPTWFAPNASRPLQTQRSPLLLPFLLAEAVVPRLLASDAIQLQESLHLLAPLLSYLFHQVDKYR